MRRKLVLVIILTLVIVCILGVSFKVRRVEASGPIYIRADGSIDPSTANITSADNVTYTFTDNINDRIVVERDNIVVDGAAYTLQGTGASYSTGIKLNGRSNVTIKNTKIKRFYYGIYLNSTYHNVVYENEITETGTIMLSSSEGNIIQNNLIKGALWHGLILWYSNNNTARNNTIYDSLNEGIWLSLNSENNIIENNNITQCRSTGIGERGSGSSIIRNNMVTYNGWDGIVVISDNNVVFNNTVVGNHVRGIIARNLNVIRNNIITFNQAEGIFVGGSHNVIEDNIIVNNSLSGLYVRGSRNEIKHNFISNEVQVTLERPDLMNTWDDSYPSGGNYWSDYNGKDFLAGHYQNEAGSDAIGDTPYVIDGNNRDNYPLMGMFSGFNATPEYCVQTICNSWITDFRFNGTALCFNATGEDDTTGFCRICIPTDLMNDAYEVFVNGTEVLYTQLACSNGTHSYLYFTYNHSTQEVVIVPEFPSFLILPLFMLATLIAVIVYRRKHSI